MHKLTIENGKCTQIKEFRGTPLLIDVLRQAGASVCAPCFGNGVCKKCAVKVEGSLCAPDVSEKSAVEQGLRLACRARLTGDAKVTLLQKDELIVTDSYPKLTPCEDGFGAAIDIGTTTVVVRIYDMKNAVLLSEAADINPQQSFSSDVMGRISASLSGSAEELKNLIRAKTDELICAACEKAGIDRTLVKRAVAVGNTAMMYLFFGICPQVLSKAPFAPVERFDMSADIGGTETVFPCPIESFIGSDTTAAVLYSGIADADKTTLLADVGTNGEIILKHKGKLYAASAAGGPAFEGAGISCGTTSRTGAICKVEYKWAVPVASTVGGAKADGICGSGIADAIAVFLQNGSIDKSGAVKKPLELSGITLTANDVRAVQLAKAAISAAIETLLEKAGISAEDVDDFAVAGGFGSSLSAKSAAKIGLFPKPLEAKFRAIGNAALGGAAMLLFDKTLFEKTKAISSKTDVIALGGNEDFSKRFIENISF